MLKKTCAKCGKPILGRGVNAVVRIQKTTNKKTTNKKTTNNKQKSTNNKQQLCFSVYATYVLNLSGKNVAS